MTPAETQPVSVRPSEVEAIHLRKVFEPPWQWKTTRMTDRRVENYAMALHEHAAGATVLESLPIRLTVESTNICNLRCPACHTGDGRVGRKRGHMPIALFEWLLRELGPTLLEVELHDWGEPLLGRNTFACIERAAAYGISTTVNTNFSIPFDAESADRLVSTGLTLLGVSIDGATQETYEKYRVRGDLRRVLENCRLVAAAKRRLHSETPTLHFGYHVFPHNVHEVEAARALADEIGMDFSPTRGWVIGQEDASTSGFPHGIGEGFPDRCFFLWFQAVVHHDGGVAPCGATFYEQDDLARVDLPPPATASFRDFWNAPNFVAARQLFHERVDDGFTHRLPCFECPETLNFEGWKEALRTGKEAFSPMTSNQWYNYFWQRRPSDDAHLVPLRVRK